MDSPRLWTGLAGLITYLIVISVYRLFSHPLRNIPGPKLAAVTHLYEWYYDLFLGGKYLFEIKGMHERYGPIVRINAREIHINDPKYYDEIYASGTHRRNKDAEFVSFTGLLLSSASTTDHDLHRYRRGLMNNFFSKKSVRGISYFVEEKVHNLMQRFEAFHRCNKVVRLDDAFAAMTSDVITHYCYGKSWDYLDDANLRADVRKAVHDLTCSVYFNRIFPIFLAVLKKLPLRWLHAIHPGRSVTNLHPISYVQLLDPLCQWNFSNITNTSPQTGTVNESLRLGGFLTTRSPRIAPDEPLTYKEYTIPPGTPVSSSSYFGHKNPNIFPEPERFSPERWISAGRSNDHLFKYITSFSRGSRICAGMNLAFLELYMTLAYFVRRFDVELVDTTVEDMRIVRDMGVGFTHRGEPTVYGRIVRVCED
ncbi:cytochrome protein [Aspergillus oryzae 3.042]|uniref:Cytochrome protein n=1 Tax=Aspergillus oryzae (strain 3.042) TaxID=1160506 RepID=I8U1J7_ASPO3|nr:cytochrome protein [Aspergillus oryzae 3.042]|eukprot:EIT80498.1 cytochrome protein [Aspergillus oryzae 3.042]